MMMASEGSKHSQSTLTPRKINIKKFTESRGPELEALHSIVADRLHNNFRSWRNKRRRTTAYDNQVARKRCRMRQKVGVEDNKDSALEKDNKKKVPRRVRRRFEFRMNPETGFCTSGDGTKRLRTHVWHAKRFKMSKLWGFYLPLGLQGTGRGSRAVLKRFKQGVLVHDASYHVAVQLEGPEDSLLTVLKMVTAPSPSALSEAISHSVISGTIYGSAMLCHVGAPSQSIAPVTYMWRSICQESKCGDAMNHNSDGDNRSESRGCCSSSRQIWMWIHVSAVIEGLDALKLACQKEMDERGCLINCFSLEGQLAKLEVSGLKAFHLLQKILHPVTCFSEKSWQLKKHLAAESNRDSQFKKSSVPKNEDDFCTRAILSLRVWDPRIVSGTRTADVPKSVSTGMPSVPEAEAKEHAASAGIVDKNRELLLSFWSKPEENGIIHNNDLWESSSRVSPPVEESILCMEKHQLRMDNFCLDAPNPGMLNTLTKVQCSRSCPIMLLKNNDQKGMFIGWSIVLPLSWVKAFWASLISKGGAHAIGFREKHWIACEMGLPFFPLDFPDCNAYSCFMEMENVASTKKTEHCRPNIRPWKVPIPPPWDTIRLTFNKGPKRVGNRETYTEEDMINGNSLAIANSKNYASSSFFHHSNSFDGMVARTCFELTDFLREIQGDHLLLFPQLLDHKTSISKSMKDDSMFGLSLKGVTQSSYDHKLCFVRVLLHAYKEGVFEEGAVVCAPQLMDISLFISRQGNDKGGIQMPQSAVRSYFKEQSSAKWELRIPEDVAIEVHRWPIGFVTTGFVRGSKKPAAVALCEAVLLAHLREEQWKNMSTKRWKEIYVLVRNLRSSSYRLALATIILERHEDLEFM